MQDDRGSVVAVDRNVDPSVIVEVAEGSASCRYRRRENGTALRRDIREAALIVSQEQRRLQIAKGGLSQLDVIHHVALSDEKVEPAIVVIVNPFRSPSGMRHGRSTEADRICHVIEGSLVIAEKLVFLISEGIHEHRRPATVFVI